MKAKKDLLKLSVFLVFLVTFFQISSCSQDSRFENKDFSNKPVNLNNTQERRKFDELSREIEKNRSLWREKNISNYDFVCERFGEGVGGDFIATISVRENNPSQVKDVERSPYKNINDHPYYKETNSIEKLFDYTQRMLEEGYRVRIFFNDQYGFPEQIGIRTQGNGWISIKVKQFEIVK